MLCAALLIVVVFTQTLVVMLRYLFAIGFVELQNAVSYGFASFCVLVIPLTLRADKHVRVDIFRNSMGMGAARKVDTIAIVILLVPVYAMAFWYVVPIVTYSWSIFEGSRDTGGLPGYFFVLTTLPIMCGLMLIQGLAILIDDRLIHTAPVEDLT